MRRLSIVLVACALSVPARAQVGSAALTGTVVDQGGAAVRGAAVTITASGTGYARTQITHDDGDTSRRASRPATTPSTSC